MHPKLTQNNLRSFCLRVIGGIFILAMVSKSSFAQVLYNESFNTVVPLPAGWASQNNSQPIGTTGWFQGNATVFPSNSGATTAYIAANYQNVNDGTISNWLFAPTVTLKNGDILTFYTRTTTGSTFPDRMQVRMSTNGASVNVGATATSVGDYTNLLLDIDPTYAGTYPQTWTQFTVTIAGLAGPTSGRIAFRYFVEDGGPNGNNSDYMGIDDVVYTTFASACTTPPVPGNTLSTAATICPTIPFTLSLENNPGTSGLTYQWQSSPDGTTWTNIAGATNATLTTTQTASTYYQNIVTCSTIPGTSTPLLVPMSAPTACYCIPANSDCTDDDVILNVKLSTLNNPSTCSPPSGYSNYSGSVAAPNIIAGAPNTITVTVPTTYTEQVVAWIDYDHSGTFEASEYTLIGSNQGNGGIIVKDINVPATAQLGITRMRVRVRFATILTGGQACTGYTFGETEDYDVNLVPCVQGVITAQPTNATTPCGGNASFTVAATGSLLSYQWEYRVSTSSPWLNVPNAAPYSGATTTTLNVTTATAAMNNYQYRVVVFGPCTAVITSTIDSLKVTPLIAVVNPASATICNGDIQHLVITNITSPQPYTKTVTSGPISIAIPDNTDNGVSTTLSVTGIPAGALITGMRVTFDLAHTYVGDMLLNLQAPNGKILNLVKYMTGTASQAGTYPNIGFVGTKISSAGGPALGTVAAQPVSGTFRADAINSLPAAFVVQNPIGFVSDATAFADLYSTINGTYTLALADGGPADFGTLTSWTIDIDYQVGVPATGVWAPITTPATIFTDAAATIPYTGTPANDVYVKPDVTTDYSVVITTAVCVSPATTVNVKVNNPVSNVSTVANATTCENGNASFAVTADGGTINYQWQISTDGGTTWSNVANAGIYSGATTSTLSLSGVGTGSDGDQFRAILTVPTCNADTTNAATLTVNANPTITIATPVTQLYPSLSTTLTASGGTGTFKWFKNGVEVAGATGSTLLVTVDDLGDYTAMVTDANGCSSATSNSITISAAANDILFIYPSPNTGAFQVRYQSPNGDQLLPRSLSVFDSKGSRIFFKQYIINAPYGKMDVVMPQNAKGIYRVELSDRNGNRIKTGSVLIL